MWKTGLLLCLAATFAMTGCVATPSAPQQELKLQISQRDQDEASRLRDRERGFRDGDRERDGVRFRRPRPNWWGRRIWYGSGARPYWWGRRGFVLNSFILLNGFYYPYYYVDGYYYPEYTTPYIFGRGVYRPYYEARPTVGVVSIPVRSARIVNYRPFEREDDDDDRR